MDNRFKIARNQHRAMKSNKGVCYSAWGLIHENFKKMDSFGHPITLTYKGRDKFQTPWGACISVIVCLGMLWVILIILSQIMTQPYQRRQVVKELIDPGLSIQGGPSFSSTPTFNETMLVEDLSDLFTFVNLETFDEKTLDVTLV